MRKNRKNRTVINRFDLGKIQPTDISVPKPETLVELAVRLQREANARTNAPVTAAAQQLTETYRQKDEAEGQTWGLPPDKLQRLVKNEPDTLYVELSLPKENPDADSETVMQSVKAEFKTFVDNLPSKGWVFNNSVRFQTFIQSQVVEWKLNGIVVGGGVKIDQSSLAVMFNWLVNHGCMPESELRYVPELVPPVEVEPESKPLTLKEALRQVDGRSRDGERILKQAVASDYVAETGVLAEQFVAHLRDVWGFVPDDASWRYAFSGPMSLVVQRNWPLHDPRTFDKVRVALVKSGRWPNNLLTCGEVIDAQYRLDNDWAAYNYNLQNLTRRGLVNRPRVEGGL